MFYKAIKNNVTVDVFDCLRYVKYQKKNHTMLLCDKAEAQAIISSDGEKFWRTDWMFRLPEEAGEIDRVELVLIDSREYQQLKLLNLKTPEEIIDEYTLWLINGGLL